HNPRALARALPGRRRAPVRSRLRRALPPPVGALPQLLRGRLSRAAHPGHPAAAGQARLSLRATVAVGSAAMRRTLYEDVHEDFRASFRTFLEREVLGEEGRYGEWERDGIVPREVFARAGQGGFLAM